MPLGRAFSVRGPQIQIYIGERKHAQCVAFSTQFFLRSQTYPLVREQRARRVARWGMRKVQRAVSLPKRAARTSAARLPLVSCATCAHLISAYWLAIRWSCAELRVAARRAVCTTRIINLLYRGVQFLAKPAASIAAEVSISHRGASRPRIHQFIIHYSAAHRRRRQRALPLSMHNPIQSSPRNPRFLILRVARRAACTAHALSFCSSCALRCARTSSRVRVPRANSPLFPRAALHCAHCLSRALAASSHKYSARAPVPLPSLPRFRLAIAIARFIPLPIPRWLIASDFFSPIRLQSPALSASIITRSARRFLERRAVLRRQRQRRARRRRGATVQPVGRRWREGLRAAPRRPIRRGRRAALEAPPPPLALERRVALAIARQGPERSPRRARRRRRLQRGRPVPVWRTKSCERRLARRVEELALGTAQLALPHEQRRARGRHALAAVALAGDRGARAEPAAPADHLRARLRAALPSATTPRLSGAPAL